ncbi:MAG TPA: histone deacetylase family protein [Candidatus Limnocylindrales bacterium]|nr:histone deacetylase family protein [Candidatus Limnocylindrales bacterium]
MRVVYSPAHLAHDVVTETVMGAVIPANEVAERAERIRRSLEADGGFSVEAPTEHGTDPILAVHDAGLLRFVEEAWREARAQSIDRPNLIADTYPTFRMFEGMSPEFVAGIEETRSAPGRAGWWGLDTANPLVAGTYGAARAAVDVGLTTADLVLGGERAAYGLCRPPGHHAARSMAGGYCFFNNAAIATEAIARATGQPVAILDVDYHHGNGTQQIFWRRGDVLYVSLHADPERQYPFFLGRANEPGEGEGSGANLNIPLPAGTDDGAYLAALDRGLEVIAATPGEIVVVSLGFDTYGHDPIGDFALTTAVYHECGRRVAALGRRLVVLQEGGYHRPSLGANARAWLRGAEGRPYDPLPADGWGEQGSDR